MARRLLAAAPLAVLRSCGLGAGDGLPIQMVGGIANGLSRAEVDGFSEAVLDKEILGGGLHDVATMSGGDWAGLAPLAP